MGLIQGLPKSLKGSSEWEVCWKKFASCRGSPRTRTPLGWQRGPRRSEAVRDAQGRGGNGVRVPLPLIHAGSGLWGETPGSAAAIN